MQPPIQGVQEGGWHRVLGGPRVSTTTLGHRPHRQAGACLEISGRVHTNPVRDHRQGNSQDRSPKAGAVRSWQTNNFPEQGPGAPLGPVLAGQPRKLKDRENEESLGSMRNPHISASKLRGELSEASLSKPRSFGLHSRNLPGTSWKAQEARRPG